MANYTKKERQEHLENWRKGGLSKNAYAKASGISPRTFTGWTWQTKKEKDHGFVEIKAKKLSGNSHGIVIEKGNITIRLPLSADMKEMQKVFVALAGIQ